MKDGGGQYGILNEFPTVDDKHEGTVREEEEGVQRDSMAERIRNKLHALAWALVGGGVLYWTNLVQVALFDDRVNRFWFNLATICFAANFIIVLYLTVWVTGVKRVTIPWNIYCPRAIPCITILGVVCGIGFNFALWRIYGLLTPIILFIVFWGSLFLLHFIPWPST